MHLSADGQDLTVRGYLAIPTFGKDQFWKRLPDSCFATLDPVLVTRVKALPKPGAPLPKGAKPPAGC
jgi:hypothetical protein